MPAEAAVPAHTRLIEEYYREIYGAAYHFSGNTEDAADLTQETFKNVLAAMAAGSVPENPKAYLLTTLKNVFFRGIFRQRKARTEDIEAFLQRHGTDELPRPEAVPPVDSAALKRAIGGLAPEFRVPLVLFYYNGSSYDDIARIMNVPIGTIMSRLARAKRYLKLALGRETEQ